MKNVLLLSACLMSLAVPGFSAETMTSVQDRVIADVGYQCVASNSLGREFTGLGVSKAAAKLRAIRNCRVLTIALLAKSSCKIDYCQH